MKRLLRKVLRKLGFEVHYIGRASSCVAHPPPSSRGPAREGAISVSPYVENSESGAVDFAEKLAREARGEPFEWPNIVALNRAVVTLLGEVGTVPPSGTVPSCSRQAGTLPHGGSVPAGAKRIAEIGGGTGCFAFEAAADPSRAVVSSELDADASHWAQEHRARPNITYLTRPLTLADGPFDVVVSVEVIEHVADFVGFLRTCQTLAPRAILTTPNRARGPRFDIPGPPETKKHVREWTAGEFYWVLRAFYRDVKLYGMPNPYVPELVPIRVTDTLSPLVADCREPR